MSEPEVKQADPAKSAPPPPTNKFLEFVTQPIKRQPTRMIVHGMEGSGKTSFAAQAKDRIFLMSRAEDGLSTLINAKRLPSDIARFPEPCKSFAECCERITQLGMEEHPFRSLVIDTINGMATMCDEHVCREQFGGDCSDSGFGSFGKGAKASAMQFLALLGLLEKLRLGRGMSIILLAHTEVTTFKDPETKDYDRYTPAMHKETWKELHRWADIILFLHRRPPQVATASKRATKGKATGNLDRVLCTERTPAYDAKNRHGLPPEIPCGNSPESAWAAFTKALSNGGEK